MTTLAVTLTETRIVYSATVTGLPTLTDAHGVEFDPTDIGVSFNDGMFTMLHVFDEEASHYLRYRNGKDELPDWAVRIVEDMTPAARAAAERSPL